MSREHDLESARALCAVAGLTDEPSLSSRLGAELDSDSGVGLRVRDGWTVLEFRGLTVAEATDIVSMWATCGVCLETMPANDRIPFQGRRAHATCAMAESLRLQALEMKGDTDRYETAAPQAPMADEPACVVDEVGCYCARGRR